MNTYKNELYERYKIKEMGIFGSYVRLEGIKLKASKISQEMNGFLF
jgi:predicted nucleotidyltransferase